MKAHFVKAKIAAKYTKSHKPKNVEAVWRTKEKVLACKLEYQIKQLSKMEKEELIKTKKLGKFFKGKFDCRKFSNVKNIMI